MSRETRWQTLQRHLRESGASRHSEMGEALRFENAAERKRIGAKHGLDEPDHELRERNIERFHRSDDGKIASTFKKKVF